MSNWDDLKSKDNPSEEEKKREMKLKEEHDARFLREVMGEFNWGYRDRKDRPWFFEKERLYNMLGFKVVDKQVLNYKLGTGQYELKQSSSSTYEIAEKTKRKESITYVLEVDTHKITDIKRYKEIKKDIDAFLNEAEEKFSSGRRFGDAIIPAYFRLEDVYTMRFQDEYNKLSRLWKALLYPLYQAGAKKFHENYITKNTEYAPLVNAYFEQVKAFKEEIKQVTNFD